jgi:hypothetical protein
VSNLPPHLKYWGGCGELFWPRSAQEAMTIHTTTAYVSMFGIIAREMDGVRHDPYPARRNFYESFGGFRNLRWERQRRFDYFDWAEDHGLRGVLKLDLGALPAKADVPDGHVAELCPIAGGRRLYLLVPFDNPEDAKLKLAIFMKTLGNEA